MSLNKFKYYAIHKPFGVLSQFTDKKGRKTLADLDNFPKDVYPVGRLDLDSEGLLLLTNDKKLTDNLLNPENKHEREYYIQVEGIPSMDDLQKLNCGVEIQGRKTLPAKSGLLLDPGFSLRIPPIRERKTVRDCWISLTICEGRNRQVRRMTAAIGYPTLRLVRVRIKNILLGDLPAGKVRELSEKEIEELKSA